MTEPPPSPRPLFVPPPAPWMDQNNDWLRYVLTVPTRPEDVLPDESGLEGIRLPPFEAQGSKAGAFPLTPTWTFVLEEARKDPELEGAKQILKAEKEILAQATWMTTRMNELNVEHTNNVRQAISDAQEKTVLEARIEQLNAALIQTRFKGMTTTQEQRQIETDEMILDLQRQLRASQEHVARINSEFRAYESSVQRTLTDLNRQLDTTKAKLEFVKVEKEKPDRAEDLPRAPPPEIKPSLEEVQETMQAIRNLSDSNKLEFQLTRILGRISAGRYAEAAVEAKHMSARLDGKDIAPTLKLQAAYWRGIAKARQEDWESAETTFRIVKRLAAEADFDLRKEGAGALANTDEWIKTCRAEKARERF